MVEPDWKEFEKLGKKIFQNLSPNADVKWNDFIYGHDSKTKRQIDVSIRSKVDEHDILTIIQLKNWKIKANINAVGEFSSVVKDVRATRGILICKGGFTTQAKKYAKNIGIKLLNLHDAQSRDWNQDIKIPVLWLEYKLNITLGGYITPKHSGKAVFKREKKFTFSTDKGKTFVDLLSLFKDNWNNGTLPRKPNTKYDLAITQKIEIPMVLKNGLEEWEELDELKFTYQLTKKNALLGYFQPNECKGIIDYHNDDAFIASHLPTFDEIPKKPEGDWQVIDDPKDVVIQIKGTYLSVESTPRIDVINKAKLYVKELK